MSENKLGNPSEILDTRPIWEQPELTEVPIHEVTASIFATSGNDGTFGFSNSLS